ncbi:hypothetical protein [Streptomyces sp. NPDC012616]|uniref:hypothetical protein n=1 Tax=Streptomyces sp. NPDC012616 TaxID=3364840 RepID=UPI0036E4F8AB
MGEGAGEGPLNGEAGRGRMAAAPSRGGAAGEADDAGRDFLDRIVGRFWTSVAHRAA